MLHVERQISCGVFTVLARSPHLVVWYHKAGEDETSFSKPACRSQSKPQRAKQHQDFCVWLFAYSELAYFFSLPVPSQKLSFRTSTPKRAQARKGLFPRSSHHGPAWFTRLLSSRSGSASHPPSLPVLPAPRRKSTELHLCSSPSPPPVIPLPKNLSFMSSLSDACCPLQEQGSSDSVCGSAPLSPALPFSHTHGITLPYPFFISLSSRQRNISFVRSLRNFLIFPAWNSVDFLSCFLHHHLMACEKTTVGKFCITGIMGAGSHGGTSETLCAALSLWIYSRDQSPCTYPCQNSQN